MRKRDQFKNSSPFLFAVLWLGIFYHTGVPVEQHPVPSVGMWLLLVMGSVILSDKGFDFFDKNDNEEDD